MCIVIGMKPYSNLPPILRTINSETLMGCVIFQVIVNTRLVDPIDDFMSQLQTVVS